ncbi:MAG: enoyl-CoA hydratase/isomerase family protein [Acidimicrobiales bacterium]
MDASALTTIRYEAADGVATITLDRADHHNAFTTAMCDEMAATWAHVREDDDVRAVVVTAAGEKAFCTGIDRSEVPADDGVEYAFDPLTYRDPGGRLGPRSNECWKPVVAAVNGMACGGAFYLLGEADILVAADHATFFDPHVTYGMPAVFEPALMLHRMPFGEVMRMTLLGNHERISAARALEIGLVSEVVPAADLQATAHRIAAAIASQPPTAVQASLRSLWAARELTRTQMLDVGNTFLNLAMSKDALAEGQKVFASGQRIDPTIR